MHVQFGSIYSWIDCACNKAELIADLLSVHTWLRQMSQALVTVQAKQQTAAAAASIGNTVDDDTHSDHTNGTHAEIKKQP